jgi:hypothetical protein
MITFSHRSSSKRVLSNCASILGLMRDDLDFTSRGDDLHPVTRSTRRCRTHSPLALALPVLPCSLQLLLSPRPSNSNDLPGKTHLTSTTPRTAPFLSLKVKISIKEKNLQNGAYRRRLRLGRRLGRRREREEVNRRLILKLDFIALLFILYSDGDNLERLDLTIYG